MTPSVPSAPDHQPGQVVAGGRFARALSRLHHRAVAHHGRDVQHVLAHGAVTQRRGAGGARGRHAADGGFLGAGVDREEQPHVAQVVVELLARDAGLHHGVKVAFIHCDDAVHAREVDREAALRRIDVTFQRGARAEGDDGHAVRTGDVDDGAYFIGILHPDHRIGGLVGDPGDGVGVLAADFRTGLQAFAESLPQDADGGGHIGARAVVRGCRHGHSANPSSVRPASRLGGLAADATSRLAACQAFEETMFTRSCSEVKIEAVATLAGDLEVSKTQSNQFGNFARLGRIDRAWQHLSPACTETGGRKRKRSNVR